LPHDKTRRWPDRGHVYQVAVGHQHMWSLLRVHATVSQDGVAEAVTALTAGQLTESIVACRYFGLGSLADLLTRLPEARLSTQTAGVLDAEYREIVPNGDCLVDAIRFKIAASPEDFPVEPA
jgi:hypothetical protein